MTTLRRASRSLALNAQWLREYSAARSNRERDDRDSVVAHSTRTRQPRIDAAHREADVAGRTIGWATAALSDMRVLPRVFAQGADCIGRLSWTGLRPHADVVRSFPALPVFRAANPGS